MGSHSARRILIGFTPALAILLTIGWMSYQTTTTLVESTGSANQTLEIIVHLKTIDTLLKDAQIAELGFVITGKENLLEPYFSLQDNINQRIEALRERLADSPSQLKRLDELEPLTEKLLGNVKTIADIRQNAGFAASQQVIQAGADQNFDIKVNEILSEMIAEENNVLSARNDKMKKSILDSRFIIPSGSIVAAVLLLLATFLVMRDFKKRRQAEADLEKEKQLVQLLRSISAAANEASNVEEAMQICVKEICQYVQCQVGHVWFTDENDPTRLHSAKVWHLAHKTNFERFIDSTQSLSYTIGEDLPGRVLESQKAEFIKNIAKDKAFLRTKEAVQSGIRMAFAFPVLAGSEVVAVFEFFNNVSTKFDDNILELTANISNQLSHVFKRSRDEKEIIKSREAALTATQAKSRFLANMSHEIRTPLNGIIGVTDLLLETNLNSQQKKYSQIIHDSGAALLNIINDILDFSKIEAGKMELELTDFSIVNLIENTTELLAVKAYEKGLSVITYIDPAIVGSLKGDPGRLTQILLNFISNAIKFTKTGNITVRAVLEGEDLETKTSRVLFSVSDTGIGLSEENMNKLFHAFSQADSSTARKYGGTGLGLSICKKLVELMGGKIGAESEENVGSTFWFSVELEKSPMNKGEKESPVFENKKILIIEDDPGIREVIYHYMSSWMSLSATQTQKECYVTNTEKALSAIKKSVMDKKPYDLILLDAASGNTSNGVKIARSLKDDLKIPQNIILMTGFQSTMSNDEVANLGCKFKLTKPIKRRELFEAAIKVLGINDLNSSNIAIGTAISQAPTIDKKTNPQISQIPAATFHKKSGKILIAEDNPVNQMLTMHHIEKLGYSGKIAANGKEVLVELKKEKYDLILMDCQMPEMDGYEATIAIRTEEQNKKQNNGETAHIPIIALTANAMKEDQKKCIESGMDGHLSKPISSEMLANTLSQYLKNEDTASINPDTLVSLKDQGDPAFLSELIRTYLTTLPERMTKLKQGFESKNAKQVTIEAHSLKSSSAALGAKGLSELSAKIEKAAIENDLKTAKELYQDFESEAILVTQELLIMQRDICLPKAQ